jgi:hypothetical protein
MGAFVSCIRLRKAKRAVTRDSYLVMPTLELRAFIARLDAMRALPPAAVATFLADVPHATDYSAADGGVGAAGLAFQRAPSRLAGGMSLGAHIELQELGYDCHLVLTKYQALKLLDFETRAELTGATPSLTELARRIETDPRN